MKKILIIYPHFPPSNLAGVHRPRLFAQHLPSFGWEPVILTVHERHYEEALDPNLNRLLPAALRVEKVGAFPVTNPRFIGDIGLRAFFQLYRRAVQLMKQEKFNFVLIPVPSFYTALLGRLLHRATGIKYGIDYIDPWVHQFPGSEKLFSRHWFSTKLARLLEPIAVRKASMITGVAEGYYSAVLERNTGLQKRAVTGAMPYGGEAGDHRLEIEESQPCLFTKNGKFQLVYAGALLPKAVQPLEAVFSAIAADRQLFEDIEFHFIGTGQTAGDPESYTVKQMAGRFGLWQQVVFEYPRRIPYLDVLFHLRLADGIFILGSTEPHYTPSKTYQAVLSGKPVFAILHGASTAVAVLAASGAGRVLSFNGENSLYQVRQNFTKDFEQFRVWSARFDPGQVNRAVFEAFSARAVTRKLAGLLEKSCGTEYQRHS